MISTTTVDILSLEPMRAAFLADEADVVQALIATAKLDEASNTAVMQSARGLVESVRSRQAQAVNTGMQSFLQQYDLSSQEGVLLMCVAEALLRIPDAATADKLIKDKFGQGDWRKHLGQSDSLLVNAGTWGMMLTGKLVSVTPDSLTDVPGWLGRMAAKAGEPIVRASLRQGMKLMAEQFVMGRDIESALKRSVTDEQKVYLHSFDMLGEGAMTAADAERYFVAYKDAIAEIARYAKDKTVNAAPGISVKISALHPRYEHAKKDRVMQELLPKIQVLAELARAGGLGLTLDAEETERLEISLEIFSTVFASPALQGWSGFGLAVQAYQKRAIHVIECLRQLAAMHNKKIMLRLVKGAYWDTEIKRAQTQGLRDYPVFTRKANTDVSYLACARKMLEANQQFYCQFATHNAHTVATILTRAKALNIAADQLEFQRLHGMGVELYDAVLAQHKRPCRVYAPVGSHEDLLPYLVRRLLENGANSSFVNRIADPDIPIERVVADPIAAALANVPTANPKLALPINLFGENRMNSDGFSFAEVPVLSALQADMAPWLAKNNYFAQPIVAGEYVRGVHRDLQSPIDLNAIGCVEEADATLVDLALKVMVGYQPVAALERAKVLDKVADLLEAARPKLLALLCREAGKTLPDGLGEVREAIDFCRYYAVEVREKFSQPVVLPGPTGETNELSLHGRGVFVCISPWNFPLAIFIGQIAAAYAAGNAVIAKPAEQTPLIASAAVRVLLNAGMASDAIALMLGAGETVGAALVADERVAGIAFTGGTSTAQAINRSLAQRKGALIPFIAETGGLNMMIADSSALPEQIVNDVLTSAFNSAGQRCSALRILCVQRDIAPRVATLLEGAMAQLQMGDPAKLETDIGPVIDRAAFDMLVVHREKMAAQFTQIGQTSLPRDIPAGHFFAPCAFAIPNLQVLSQEVFGPILHVYEFAGEDIFNVVDSINQSGYGLTLGIHSRIEETIAAICARAKVGNIYVNRNQVGAVVGVQPFGGEGLSGTGPKAGGPHYLMRFASERCLTVNTAAAGGNASLIAGTE